MKFRMLTVSVVCLVFAMGFALSAFGQELKPIQLPEPKLDSSKSLAQALKERKTTRAYGSGDLSQQALSNLLWAAFGINRPDSGRRTAPSAHHWWEIDIYVAAADGLYLYAPKANALIPVVKEDIRALTGTQSYFKDAAINLVYVADLSKMEAGGEGEADKIGLSMQDTGFIGQNVYLYCASEGLATVFRALIDKEKLAETMKLRTDQRITGAQTVGLPKSGK